MAIRLFRAANRTGKLSSRDVIAEQCADLRVIGASERVLCGGDFDVVGHSGLKAPLRERDLFVRQRYLLPAKLYLANGRLQFNLAITHLFGYAIAFLSKLPLGLLLY